MMTQTIDNLKIEIERIIKNAQLDIEDIEVESVDDIEDLNLKNDDFKVINAKYYHEYNCDLTVEAKLKYKEIMFKVHQYFVADMNREYDLTEIVVEKL